MRRRIVIAVVLAVLLAVFQLIAGSGWAIALVTALIGGGVAFLVLLVSDRWFNRR